MRLISWNVNGLRAAVKKGFQESFDQLAPDILALQEIKLQEGQIEMELPGYHQYWNYAEKKGYSGTAVFTKKAPNQVTYGIGIDEPTPKVRNATIYSEIYGSDHCPVGLEIKI